MRRFLYALLTGSLPLAAASAQTLWSQSTDNTSIVPGSAACLNNPNGVTENGFWRLYDPVACGFAGDYQVESVTFGVENATTTSGSTTITVNLFSDPTPGSPGPVASLALLGSMQVNVIDTTTADQTFETATFNPPVFVPAGTLLAVEVFVPDGQPQGDFFFIGSNTAGETPPDSSFVSADDCGVTDPVPTSAIGFPVHFIIDVTAGDASPVPIGTSYCPNNPNSTGLPGVIAATGRTAAAANSVFVTASQLPPNQFGFFIASRTQGLVMNPGGSLGNICVLGNQARYNQPSQIGNSGAGGTFALTVGNINVPTNPAPGEPIAAGDTWNWQAWYRDIGTTNNFTNAVSVTFN